MYLTLTSTLAVLVVWASAFEVAAQSPSATPARPIIHKNTATAGPDDDAIHEYVSYSADAPECGIPTVTVQTLTNPFSEPCIVFVNFSVDDDIIIDGQVYQSPGTDFTYNDTADNPCPDANGAHSDQYSRVMNVGEQITLGVRNNFRGKISLSADVYFNKTNANTKPCDRKDGGNQVGCCAGMARYSAHSMLASLNVVDTPIRYTPPRGAAIDFTVTYNQRERQQPQTFTYSNLGPKWTFNWLSYVSDDPNNASANVAVYVLGGGAENYSGFDSGSQSYLPDPQSHTVLIRTGASSYEKHFPDGSKQIFNVSDGSTAYPRKIFMTQTVDSAGNSVAIGYDSSFRIITITDALGQVTTLSYELPGDPLKITKVTEPFPTGRSAIFTYTNGQLTTMTDEIGIQSVFHYAAGTDFIDSLTTPYGTTTFASGQSGTNRWLEMTDPLGGKERVEYRDSAPGISAADPAGTVPAGFTNSGLDVANTFYWDKKATEMYPPVDGVYDYTKARVIHWGYNADGSGSGIVGSEKAPLENRVWRAYAGQSDTNHAGPSANPSQIARVLDDGTTQLWRYEYNGIGRVTKSTDPVGRVMSYDYDPANNIDLIKVRQTTGSNNEVLRTVTYNSLHEPLTDKDAAGQTTIYSYNSFGQKTSVQNARGEITTYAYGDGSTGHPIGYLSSVTGPKFNGSSAVTSFTYDGANRVRTVTNNPDNYAVTTDYDALDRPTQIAYPDGTNRQFQYAEDFGDGLKTILDLTASKDRLGRWTTRHYNANRRMDSITDPLGHSTLYQWCTCGSLTGIIDPNGNLTTFDRDLQSRITSKVFADCSTINYNYENTTSRLKSMTDALNQITNYSYFSDDNIQQVSYTNALSPTPTVSYVYDPNYNRIRSMIDGIGTTNYSYYPIAAGTLGAGKLYQVDGPFSNDTISYGYDELGRFVSQDINGTVATISYDSLGRVGTTTNALGSFARTYDSVTSRLLALSYPNGQTANYSYFGNANDRRQQTLQNLTANSSNLSRHDYTYDPEGQIQTWNKTLGTTETDLSFRYDDASRLLSVVRPDKGFSYEYDDAGNRLIDAWSATHIHGGNFYSANNLNQLDTVTKSSGVGPSYGPFALTYDANGNVKYDGSNQTFEWDAANRLVAINYSDSGNRTEFAYDGLGRRVKITEYAALPSVSTPFPVVKPVVRPKAPATSAKTLVWCGNQICEERDGSGQIVMKRFFAEGEQRVGGSVVGNFYYTRDHLGSVREVSDAVGNLQAQYDYDAWGIRTVVSGNISIDFGFTGHYLHQPSGLNLSLYRAYNPTLGRWLSRDPIGESGGANLYAYVGNDPVDKLDPTGLAPVPCNSGEVAECQQQCQAQGDEYVGCTADAGSILGIISWRNHFCICKKGLDLCRCSCPSGKQVDVKVPKGSPCPPNVENVVPDFVSGPGGIPIPCPRTETCPCAKISS